MRGTLTAFLISAVSLCGQTAPPSFQTLSQQADAARDAKQLDKALALYQRALKLKPDWDEGLWNLGSIAYDLDQYAECAPAFRRLAGLKPDSAPAWTMAGLCEYKLRTLRCRAREPEPCGESQVRGAARTGARRRLHLALVLTKTGSFERAITVLTELTLHAQESAGGRRGRGDRRVAPTLAAF